MNENTYTIEGDGIPFQLTQIPQPPKRLFVQGKMPNEGAKILCIVGARKYSSYGEEATRKLILGLKGYNICIVSGLALGIDGIAHRAALDAGLQTIAFPGSGLDRKVLYPSKHKKLANEILYAGGGLISEFEMIHPAFNWTFPMRNRLMAGISEAVIVVEAELLSGSLITTRLALDYNRNVGIVPGQITSKLSDGPHSLIKDGATPVTCSADILEMLGFQRPEGTFVQRELLLDLNEKEKKIIEELQIESLNKDQLVQKFNCSAQEINGLISSLEIQGLIKEVGGKFRIN